MTAIDLNIAANGRMVLPKAVREAMGLQGASRVTVIVDEDGVRLESPLQRLERARAVSTRGEGAAHDRGFSARPSSRGQARKRAPRQRMFREDAPADLIDASLDALGLDVRAHDTDAAYRAAELLESANMYGSGLGDRSCMALSLQLGLPILTTDREWTKVEIERLELRHVRGKPTGPAQALLTMIAKRPSLVVELR